MTEDIIKVVLLPVATIFYFVIARVLHINPSLITSFFTQSGNAQSLTLQQRAINCKIPAAEVAGMDRKTLNDRVADCEVKK